ncbi:hypothetical protein BD626DRAFT_391154 [Schizophyllum amplum]|uniref:Uncharacterized protein n=1 Tax=Schizophyllum amplum TaxID=97359 RepID=A0A550CVS6_9AGAR|nr:hypothetical protein BD626DRAFT_391154 [Auriculariopsis ampla]
MDAFRTRTQSNTTLSDAAVADAFHSYLKSSLAQARAEHLVDADMLASAEADQLMVTGPALCLYFAALRCTTNPPSVPLPRPRDAKRAPGAPAEPPVDLSFENCPPQFAAFLRVWASTVPAIQALAPETQHDLARLICGLQPLTNPPDAVRGLAEDMRAVAIEISQRRSFQDRYAEDLQAALDAAGGGTGRPPQRASFVPPPTYEAAASPPGGTTTALPPSPSYSPSTSASGLPPHSQIAADHAPHPTSSSPTRQHLSPPITPTASTSARSRTPSPSMLIPEVTSTLMMIRETLYASILDVLSTDYTSGSGPDGSNERFLQKLKRTFREDPGRAYYTTVALAILHFARYGIVAESGRITGVLGAEITLENCPRALRPLMAALVDISRTARTFEEEDDTRMAIALSEGRESATSEDGEPIELGLTRLARVRRILENGIGWADTQPLHVAHKPATAVHSARGGSPTGRTLAFANAINSLALRLTHLGPFRERAGQVFQVLAGL